MAKITFHSWYYKMIRQKTKKDYLVPHVNVAEADLEGLICLSAYKAVNVDQLRNMNDPNSLDQGAELEPFYFESNE